MSRARDADALVAGAREVLRGNDLGSSTKPSPTLYPHQWNWDSCFIAIGLSHVDTARAAAELRSLLRGQWRNGMVPQIVFNPHASGYFPGPEVWQSERSPDAPRDVRTSGITDPPVLAIAALAVWKNADGSQKGAAREFLVEVFPKIVRFHRFFYEERNPDGDGLVVVVHPWESGLDNSPPYLDAGHRVHLTYKPHYERLDLLHVPAANRPTNKDYDLFVWLLEQMRAVSWNQRRYLETAALQVQDVIFNSILCRANAALVEIAGLIGEQADEWEERRRQTAAAIEHRLWDDHASNYFSYDRVAGQLLKDDTIAGFHTLFGGAASPDRARRLVDEHLLSPAEYWPAVGFAVPTTALNSSWFNAENYWLGPVWVNTNWMVSCGLVDYDRPDLAAEVDAMTLDLVRRSGFREYFNPSTGEGYGTNSFSWTAALTIDLVERREARPEPTSQ